MARPPRSSLDRFAATIRACRICVERPAGAPLPHQPKPVFQLGRGPRLVIASQAPGTRAHLSGTPFNDRSGDRLRDWTGLTREAFYDPARVAIVPMGFCFPGQTADGSDLPPRRECAPAWRREVFRRLPAIELILAIGRYALEWHRPEWRGVPLTALVADWRAHLARPGLPIVLPLPHPSWRNNAWLAANPWFETELVPVLRAEVARLTAPSCADAPVMDRVRVSG